MKLRASFLLIIFSLLFIPGLVGAEKIVVKNGLYNVWGIQTKVAIFKGKNEWKIYPKSPAFETIEVYPGDEIAKQSPYPNVTGVIKVTSVGAKKINLSVVVVRPATTGITSHIHGIIVLNVGAYEIIGPISKYKTIDGSSIIVKLIKISKKGKVTLEVSRTSFPETP